MHRAVFAVVRCPSVRLLVSKAVNLFRGQKVNNSQGHIVKVARPKSQIAQVKVKAYFIE